MDQTRIEVVRSVIWQMTSTIVVCGRSALVVDPGVFPAEVEAIRRRIPAGVRVEALFFTHHHWDHVVGHFAFPGVRVYASSTLARAVAEQGALAREALEEARRHDGTWYVERPGGYRWPEDLRGLEDGFHFNVGDLDIEVLGLPGHAPDAVGLRAGETLVVGDYLSPLEIPFVDDLEAYRRTLRRLLALSARGVERVVPGHGPPPDGGRGPADRPRGSRLPRCARPVPRLGRRRDGRPGDPLAARGGDARHGGAPPRELSPRGVGHSWGWKRRMM